MDKLIYERKNLEDGKKYKTGNVLNLRNSGTDISAEEASGGQLFLGYNNQDETVKVSADMTDL